MYEQQVLRVSLPLLLATSDETFLLFGVVVFDESMGIKKIKNYAYLARHGQIGISHKVGTVHLSM